MTTIDPEGRRGAGYINLMIYSDSLAFPRQSTGDAGATYPFRLREIIERELGLRVNLMTRGAGAATAAMIHATVLRDTGYLAATPAQPNYAVLQFGIVDSAPRPFTYAMASLLKRIPVIGPAVLAPLVKRRPLLQRIWSYQLTSPRRFRRLYEEILRACRRSNIVAVGVTMPLPPVALEERSPGFRRKVEEYNRLIRGVAADACCDVESGLTEQLRESILMTDGHHLSDAGHRLYAERIFAALRPRIVAVKP